MNKDYIIHQIENIFYDNDMSIDKKIWEANKEIEHFKFSASAISDNEFKSLYDMITKQDLNIRIKWESDTSWISIELYD